MQKKLCEEIFNYFQRAFNRVSRGHLCRFCIFSYSQTDVSLQETNIWLEANIPTEPLLSLKACPFVFQSTFSLSCFYASLWFLCFPCDINLSSEEARDRESVEAWGARLVYSFEISLGPFENLFSFLQSPVLFVLSSSLRDGCKRFSVLFSRCAVLRFKSYAFARWKVSFCLAKGHLLNFDFYHLSHCKGTTIFWNHQIFIVLFTP